MTSPRREAALRYVAEVVPSVFGDARFTALAPGWDPTSPATSCGTLPAYVAHRLGCARGDMIGRAGTFAIRTAGQDTGTWIKPGGGRRPKPGDIYALADPDGGIVHVGIIVSANGPTWTTADAGQGTHAVQEAKYVTRPYDPATMTLAGPAGPRALDGWIDLDAYPFPPGTPSGEDSGDNWPLALLALAALWWIW